MWERLVEATTGAQPDLIAFTHDIADARSADIRDVVAPLCDLLRAARRLLRDRQPRLYCLEIALDFAAIGD